tara:strand:+ start:506 stop:760 length:255 start_codon:yes stop_codon:yes gene_type:complete
MFNLKYSFRNSILVGYTGEQSEVINKYDYTTPRDWYSHMIDIADDRGFTLAYVLTFFEDTPVCVSLDSTSNIEITDLTEFENCE